MMSEQAKQARAGGASGPGLVLPVMVLVIAFLAFTGFHTYELIQQRRSLSAALANQEQPLQEVQKLRSQIGQLAAETVRLADSGDAAAKDAEDQLARQHISLRAPPASPTH